MTRVEELREMALERAREGALQRVMEGHRRALAPRTLARDLWEQADIQLMLNGRPFSDWRAIDDVGEESDAELIAEGVYDEDEE